jgi:hypothetical protein
VFAGAVTPPHLTTAEFAAATARALRPGGVYAVNIAAGPAPAAETAPRRPHDGLDAARSAVATIRSVYSQTCTVAEPSVLRGRRRGNLVIFASDQPLPEAALSRAAAADPFPARLVAGEELRRFIAGAPVVTDAAIAAGPAASTATGSAASTAAAANVTAPPGAAAQPTNW